MIARLLGIAAASLSLLVASANAGPPLVSKGVTVMDTASVGANVFGTVVMSSSEVAGEATLSDGDGGPPQITLLGCRFDVIPKPDQASLQRAAPIFSRKIATAGDPPPAGYGRLKNPKPVGITDPITTIACNDQFTYVYFLFRQTPTYGNLIVEALVLEFDDAGLHVFETEQFDPLVEKPSVQTRDVLQVARGLYRMSFRSRDDAAEAQRQAEEFDKTVLSLGMKTVVPILP